MIRFTFADDVRAVLFDAGNTLLSIDHERIAALLSDAGLPCDEAAVRLAEMRARPRLDPYLRTATRRESTASIGRYVDEILAGLVGPAPAAARSAVIDAWRTLWVRPPCDAHATLDALSRRGYRLGVVSNSNGTVRSLLETAGLAGSLECVVDSGEVGMEKPDPRIFRLAADLMALAPRDCVYLGDFLSLDVMGARAAGMHAVLIDPIGAWGEVDAPRVASLTEFAARLVP